MNDVTQLAGTLHSTFAIQGVNDALGEPAQVTDELASWPALTSLAHHYHLDAGAVQRFYLAVRRRESVEILASAARDMVHHPSTPAADNAMGLDQAALVRPLSPSMKTFLLSYIY